MTNKNKLLNPINHQGETFQGNWDKVKYYFIKYTKSPPKNNQTKKPLKIFSVSFFVIKDFANSYFQARSVPNQARNEYIQQKISSYYDGLEELIKVTKKTFPDFKFRIYCDYSSIHLVEKFLDNDHVELVYYLFPQFFDAKKMCHHDFFGSLIRYLPLFDFEEQKADLTCILDVDIKFYGLIKMIQYFAKNPKMKILFRYRACNKTLKRVLEQKLKIPANIISSFLIQRDNLPQKIFTDYFNDCLLEKCADYQEYLQQRYETKNFKKYMFEYGVDEYFLNGRYMDYYYNNRIPINLALLLDDSSQGITIWLDKIRESNYQSEKINEFIHFLVKIYGFPTYEEKKTPKLADLFLEDIYNKKENRKSFTPQEKKSILEKIAEIGFGNLEMHSYLFDCLLENLSFTRGNAIVTLTPQKNGEIRRFTKYL